MMFASGCASISTATRNERAGYEVEHHPNECFRNRLRYVFAFNDPTYFRGMFKKYPELEIEEDKRFIDMANSANSLSVDLKYTDKGITHNPKYTYTDWKGENNRSDMEPQIRTRFAGLWMEGVDCFCQQTWALSEYEIDKKIGNGVKGTLSISTDKDKATYDIVFEKYEWKIISRRLFK